MSASHIGKYAIRANIYAKMHMSTDTLRISDAELIIAMVKATLIFKKLKELQRAQSHEKAEEGHSKS